MHMPPVHQPVKHAVPAAVMPRVYLLRQERGRRYYYGVGWPKRRLRQHNTSPTAGAVRTRTGRPWALVLEVHGFASRTEALKFEWRLHHPAQSYELRGHPAIGDYSLRGQLRLLAGLLKTFRRQNSWLGVHFVRDEFSGSPFDPALDAKYDRFEQIFFDELNGGAGSGRFWRVFPSYGRAGRDTWVPNDCSITGC